jgi:hypothetical protein
MSQNESPPAQTAPRPNLRRSRRQAPKGGTKVRAFRNSMGLGPNIAVSLLDVSETGIRMVLKEALPKDREFEIALEGASVQPVKTFAYVVWCVPTADGQFCVGAHFKKPLTMRDLSVLARS